jgi:hypothetical protein|tara:strand:+ start:252 stop:449 length:198 start_codon:yes stop_codon:yes gene_type:complete
MEIILNRKTIRRREVAKESDGSDAPREGKPQRTVVKDTSSTAKYPTVGIEEDMSEKKMSTQRNMV